MVQPPFEPDGRADMMWTFGLVLALVILGDVFVWSLNLPVPGAVIGLLLLSGHIAWRRGPDRHVSALFDAVVPHVQVLFVPAGVGVMTGLEAIATEWAAFAAAIIGGTFVTLCATGLSAMIVFRFLDRWRTVK